MTHPHNFLIPMLVLAACDTGGSRSADVSVSEVMKRVSGQTSTGGTLALVASLAAADAQRLGPGVALPAATTALANDLAGTANSALRSLVLESGSGVDPVWSPLIGALAEAAGAAPDANGNGTNRDEVLARLRARYEFRSNAKLPNDLAQSFVLPSLVTARLAGKPTSRGDARNLRLVGGGAVAALRLGDLGSLIRATTRRAVRLLAVGRGDYYGATPEDGMRGLLLLEKAVAAERLLLEELAFDGKALGRIRDPGSYDAKAAPKLFPTRIEWLAGSGGRDLPSKPVAYVAKDRGASLGDQARLLRGAAELAWLASPRQPNPLLRRLFEGDPFGKGPQRLRRGLDTGAQRPFAEPVTWESQIKGLLQSSCTGSGCHSSPGPANNFSVESYALVKKGGDHEKTNPIIVKGDASKSLLWQVVALANPPVTERMPLGGPFFGKTEISLIADWINQGALEKDPNGKTVEPEAGRDTIVVILKNLAAMHAHASGALVDRVEIGGAGELVHAGSAGEIMLALAAVRDAAPDLVTATQLLENHALFVARKLVQSDGRVLESYELANDRPATASASIGDAAAVAGGLFEADRVLGRDEIRKAARRAAEYLLSQYLISERPSSFPRSTAVRLTPATVARIFDAAAAWFAADGDRRARDVVARVWATVKARGLVLAEWPETGELFGDGVRDTDNDRVPEVGTEGLPPLFAAALENDAMARGAGIPARRVHYSRDLLPTLIEHCSQCHTGGAKLGDFQLDTFADLFRGGEWRSQTTSIVPGKPDESFFYRKVQDRPPALGEQMPQALPPLAPEFRALIRLWIEQGAVRD